MKHIFFGCNDIILNNTYELKQFFMNQNMDFNMKNILYPLENELLEINKTDEFKAKMDIRINIIDLALKHYSYVIKEIEKKS